LLEDFGIVDGAPPRQGDDCEPSDYENDQSDYKSI
jgi:hypothetical protein